MYSTWSQIPVITTFQAGHAGSIPVTRSNDFFRKCNSDKHFRLTMIDPG